ncbi:cupredoxin domain-containing protein [Saxibacter everestensis]|uniref:Cupredoxin domain-containing protein n=1 Tax=Saxibacter everestensis TaxID=2909229 RepID=A0ABY8R0H0_9MICO|nr:cupredoxin domain-containing protein [Brevibacteriaceae bacterium ZFBP1038]
MAALTALALLAGLAGCGQGVSDEAQGDDPAKSAVTIEVAQMSYSPSTVTVQVGESVTWKFDDGNVRHDVVSADGSFKSKIADGGSYTYTFDKPGTYAYSCSLHPAMTGTVVVEG